MTSPTACVVHGRIAAGAEEEEAHEEVPENDLNPIAPEVKEMVWGFGAFVVLAVLMRWVLFPRMQQGHGRPLRR